MSNELADVASRLRWQRLKSGLSQANLAEMAGVSQVTIQHLESGRNQNSKHLISIATALKVDPSWLLNGEGLPAMGDIPMHTATEIHDMAIINQWNADPSIIGKGGNGVFDSLAFQRDWLKRHCFDEPSMVIFYCADKANEPTLSLGDVLLIDISKSEPVDGKLVMILNADKELICRRLVRPLTGGWIIRCDNPDKGRYPDMALTDAGFEDVVIMASVVWKGGRLD